MRGIPLIFRASIDHPQAEVKMGDDDEAMEYDQDLIFKHLLVCIMLPTNL